LQVPTPFSVGAVNCYLLEGTPLTLVDTGLNSGTSLDRLERALAERSVRIEDLELIVLTHQHMDHEGLLEIVTRRSGAEVAAFHALVPWLGDYRQSAADDDAFSQALMRRHGIADEVVTVLGVLGAGLHAYGSGGTVTRALHHGDTLRMGGRDFSVHHRPGHSASDLVFLDARAGILLAGDHLLPHISSNALVTRPLGAAVDAPRPTPLLDYASSMAATRLLPAQLVLPGHGDPISDHVALIDSRLLDQQRRAQKIRGLLAARPLSAHAIAVQMWGRVALTQAYLTLSEVLGHLDLLLADGSAIETESDGVSLFAAAGDGCAAGAA
jgi:glyoxylase-like metal-dependent hydrolase (beta-lactamase superfamily II)